MKESEKYEIMDKIIEKKTGWRVAFTKKALPWWLGALLLREIEDGKSFRVMLLIKLFQFLILRCEPTFGCCVDNKDNLVGILF